MVIKHAPIGLARNSTIGASLLYLPRDLIGLSYSLLDFWSVRDQVRFGMTALSWTSVEYVVSSFDAAICAIDETKLWLSLSVCQTAPKSLFWAPPVYQDLSTHHDWSVKKGMVDLLIRLKGNSKRISGNSWSPSAAQNKDLGAAALQKLVTGVKLRLLRRLWCRGYKRCHLFFLVFV